MDWANWLGLILDKFTSSEIQINLLSEESHVTNSNESSVLGSHNVYIFGITFLGVL